MTSTVVVIGWFSSWFIAAGFDVGGWRVRGAGWPLWARWATLGLVAMMVSDEVTALRLRLERGDWRALLDPLLSLVLLSDPGDWWRRASHTCRLELVEQLASLLPPDERLAALDDWRNDVVPGSITWMIQWSLENVARDVPGAFSQAMFQMLADGTPRFRYPDSHHCVVRALLAHLPASHRLHEGQQAATALAVLEQWSVR